MSDFSERLRLAMDLAQVSVIGLAKHLVDQRGKLGVSRTAVYYALSGESKSLSGENVLRAAKALRVDPWWLATGEGVPRKLPGQDRPSALELLSALGDLIRAVPPAVRPAIASNLSGWVLEGGTTHYAAAVSALLEAASVEGGAAGPTRRRDQTKERAA
jgi:hypothetical protein